jgi:N-acetylneuraminic acid mutarotase
LLSGATVLSNGGAAYGFETGVWVATGGSHPPATGAAAATTNGRVIAAGGRIASGFTNAAKSYSLTTRTWSDLPPMHLIRVGAKAIALPDGRVAVVGGDVFATPTGGANASVSTVETYDPSTSTWSDPVALNGLQNAAAVVALSDGRVFVAGGGNNLGVERDYSNLAEIYDPTTDTVTPLPPMLDARMDTGGVQLPDGRVLVVGGCCDATGSWNAAEVYDFTSNSWTSVASMHEHRAFGATQAVHLLQDGRVIALGGVDNTNYAFGAEIYDPVSDQWTVASDSPSDNYMCGGGELADGSILVATCYGISLTATQIYQPSTDTWTTAPAMNPFSFGWTPVNLPDGTLLTVGGGTNVSNKLYSAPTVLFDPTSSSQTCTSGCVSVGDVSVLEGDAGSHTISFPVTLSQPATATVTVPYMVADASATGGAKIGTGIDYKTKAGTLTFKTSALTGKTGISKTIAVTVFGDTTVEPDEIFKVMLGNPTTGGYVLGRSMGTGTIMNDDGVTSGMTIAVGDASIVGAAAGKQSLKIPVTLSAKATSRVTVNYAATPDSADFSSTSSLGGDYGGKVLGQVSFGIGAQTKMISIPIWADPNPDPDESFTITLSGLNGSGVTIARTTATATILGGWH